MTIWRGGIAGLAENLLGDPQEVGEALNVLTLPFGHALRVS